MSVISFKNRYLFISIVFVQSFEMTFDYFYTQTQNYKGFVAFSLTTVIKFTLSFINHQCLYVCFLFFN